MKNIAKQIVFNEEMQPCFVQISYQDWLDLERLFVSKIPEADTSFIQTGMALQGKWQHGDGLAYQMALRSE